MAPDVQQQQRPDFIEGWMKDYYGSAVTLDPKRLGFGRSPALLIVDFQKTPKRAELVRRAIANTVILLDEARKKGIPVFYTVIAYRKDLKDFIPNKIQPRFQSGTSDQEVVDELKPRDDEVVLTKKGNSAFMGTGLMTLLTMQRIDTLIVAGCHTAGCVRATASDSSGLGFRTIIPEECVGDGRGWNPHIANLCDLHIRGADVLTLQEVIEYLRSLP